GSCTVTMGRCSWVLDCPLVRNSVDGCFWSAAAFAYLGRNEPPSWYSLEPPGSRRSVYKEGSHLCEAVHNWTGAGRCSRRSCRWNHGGPPRGDTSRCGLWICVRCDFICASLSPAENSHTSNYPGS